MTGDAEQCNLLLIIRNDMKCEVEISLRIMELKKNIRIVDKRRSEELEKPFSRRDRRLLLFLNKESDIYQYALLQLEWALSLIIH